jgi:hypothetical protein
MLNRCQHGGVFREAEDAGGMGLKTRAAGALRRGFTMGGVLRITKRLVALTFVTLTVVTVTFLALLALGGSASAAEKTLSWWRDACGYSVSFDSDKFEEVRVRNTVHLLYGPPDFAAPSVGLPVNPQSVARLNPEDHPSRECKAALDVAGRLEFLPLAGIEDYRRALVDEIKDMCEFETAEIRGLRDPSALRDYRPAVAACSPLVDALEGRRDIKRDDIKTAFRRTLDERCSGEADSVRCVNSALARAQRPDGDEWVQLYLVRVGWNRCASAFTSRTVDGRKREQLRAELEEQFGRSFKITRHSCEAAKADSSPRSGAATAALAEATPGKPAATAEKPRSLGCSLKPTLRGRRAEPVQASCAAGNPLRRSVPAASGLPSSLSAGWTMQDRSFTWR